jgi:2-aminoadipate transaminase
MNWTEKFAERSAVMKRSPIRELLKVGNRPGMVSLAGGLPAAELFPIAEIEAATQRVLREHGRKALQYGETEGLPELRDWIADSMGARRENILITTGAQQGLDLLGRILLNSGDRVVVENPTYLAALSAWRPNGVRFLAAPTDADGLSVEALPPLLAQNPKLLYTQPNFQNPQGTTLAAERRPKLIQLAREHAVPLIEDDPYGELWFDSPPLKSLFELEGDPNGHVVYLGTFSKTLAPALRVGWVIGAEALLDKLALAKQSADLQSSTFNQHIALEILRSGLLEKQIPKLRAAYRERRDAMLEALEKYFPNDATWTKPAGGLFVWVTLRPQLNALDLLPHAVEQNVTFVPGEDFHTDGTGQNTMRLNFSNATVEQIHCGIERLAKVIR